MYQPAWQAQKGKGEKEERKARKREKGKGAFAVRAGVFVFRPAFSELPSPQSPSIFPSSLTLTHCNAYHAG